MRKIILVALLALSSLALGQPIGGGGGIVGPLPALIGAKGTTLPSLCTIGQLFFKTNATAGQNIYACTSANTWTQSSGSGVISSGTIGQLASYTAATTLGGIDAPCLTGTPAAGDLTYFSGVGASPCNYNQALLTAASGTTGAYLRSAGTGAAPIWSTLILPNAATTGQIPSATSTNTITMTATPTLGASGTVGTLALGNATSGTVTLGTVAGALGSVTASLPANTGTVAELNYAQTWTATQTFPSPVVTGSAVTFTSGTSRTIANASEIIVCTSTCTVTPPGTLTAGQQFCVQNDDNVSTVITLAAVTAVQYEATARTSYGTANHTMTSGGAVKDQICMVAVSTTKLNVFSSTGTWTNN